MKKIAIATIAVFVSLSAMSYTVTNTVVIVSNIYNRIVIEVTNNVKNTHSNHFYTNNIHTIEHQTLVVSKTNTTINLDVSQQAIDRARQYADQSSTYANNSSASATSSANSASSSSSSASQAYSYLSQTRSAASSAVSDINSAKSSALTAIGNEKAWFSEHFGQMVTNANITIRNEASLLSYTYGQENLSKYGVGASFEKKIYAAPDWHFTHVAYYPGIARVRCHIDNIRSFRGSITYSTHTWNIDTWAYLYCPEGVSNPVLHLNDGPSGIPYFEGGVTFLYNNDATTAKQAFYMDEFKTLAVRNMAFPDDYSWSEFDGRYFFYHIDDYIQHPGINATYAFPQGLSEIGLYLNSLSNWVERVFQKK